MEKRNNNNLIEVTPKKELKNLIILTLLLINIPSLTSKEISKKLIIEKNTFIDDCSKDDIYQYEYNNICYILCPRGTQVSKTNKNLCENKYKMINEIKAKNKSYEINNSSSSLNNIFNKANLRKMQVNDENDAIIELRNKIKNKDDSDMTKLLKDELKEIKKTHKGNPYQIITTNYQNDNDNDKISTVKLGKCENILKIYNNIAYDDPLIIFKFDYYKEGLLVPIIEYEVYSSNRNKLNLSICQDIGIEISVPLLTEKEDEACIQLCDEKCEFLSYSSDNKKYNCKCEAKNSMTDITDIEPQSWNQEGLFKNYCKLKNGNVNMDKEDIIALRDDFKFGKLNRLIPDVIAGNDIVIKNKNIAVQITTTDNQRNNNYNNLSAINLGECENKYREVFYIPNENPLFIFKVDSYNEDSLIPIVEYEAYKQNFGYFEILQLNKYCKDIKIDIKIPTNLREEETERYNLSNNEKCSSYEEENEKDISLKDWKKESKPLCQSNCNFEEYNSNTKMINCECKVKEGISTITEFTFDKNIELDTIFSSDSSKSINLFDCTTYFFSKEGFQNNSGCYILLCLIVLNIIILIIFFLVKGKLVMQNEINKLSNFNQKSNNNNAAINNNNVYNNNIYNNGNNINNAYNNGYNNNPVNNGIAHVNVENNNYLKSKKKGRSNKKKNSQKNNKGKTVKKNVNIPQISVPPKKSKINKNSSDLKVNVDSSRKQDSNIEFRNIGNQGNLRNINNIPGINNNINYNYNLPNNYQINNQMNNQIILIESKQCFYFNIHELNHMSYINALLYDKRTFFQYYLSLIKCKNMIYFTFILKTDYNPALLKYSIFVLFFCFIFIINTIFIANIRLVNKDENFVNQIPQLICIVLITRIFNAVIEHFFLPEKKIIRLRYAENIYEHTKIIKDIICSFKIYFLVSFIFLFFIWYYVGLFCAVYKNTQIYLIKNVFISFAIYLLIPFIFCFIPGFLRIYSLRSRKGDKEYLYRISNFLIS